jgi:hypothetical protein
MIAAEETAMKAKTILLALSAASLPAVAAASTPEAWANLDTRVNRACIAMSGIDRPQVLSQKISTSDTIGVEIRLVRGYDNRRRFLRKICVFDRRTSRTEVHDAGGWFGTTVRP